MKKLSKTQLNLFDLALDQLYSYLKRLYGIDYTGNIMCAVYNDIIHLQQCSLPPGITWFADIALKERKVHISIREVEHDTINSKRDYDLFYMGSKPNVHTIFF